MQSSIFFMMGMPRTGAKIYQSSLNKLPNVEVFDEVHFLRPFWIGKCFERSLRNLTSEISSKVLSESVFRKFFSELSSFWHSSKFKEIGFNKIFHNHSLPKKATPLDVLDRIINVCSNHYPKSKIGFRALVYQTYIDIIRQKYPNTRIIFTVRDPRAIFQSSIQNDLKKNPHRKRIFFKYYSFVTRYFYTILFFLEMCSIKRKYGNDSKIFFVRYEDVVTKNEITLNKLCNFLQVDYSLEMLRIPRQDSSYSKNKIDSLDSGVDPKLKDAWKSNINPIVANSLSFFLKKHMKIFNYKVNYL